MKKKTNIKILEINNTDILGKRFNGYDLVEYINNSTNFKAKQLVNLVQSSGRTSASLYDHMGHFAFEQELSNLEYKKLSVHSQLSISTDFLLNHNQYKKASLLHFHMFHNSKFNLYSLKRIANEKPTVITFHDLWFLTGRCAQPFECAKWLNGCENCEYLDTVFPMHIDNCNALFKLKEKIFKDIDLDVVVASPYMLNAVKQRDIVPENRLHFIPFGIDLNLFCDNNKKDEIKKKLNIAKENIVLFFRAQNEFKGTEYIVEALQMLKTDKNITLISCGEKGLLGDLENKYQIIEMGTVGTKELLDGYRACDMFLMTSKAESFGFMAIEAMACSRPVVVFNNTALPHVTFAPECGILVENRNSKKLKEAIEKLINDEDERLRRGKLGRKLAIENYNIDEYHKKMVELYKKVLKRKRKNYIKENIEIDYQGEDVQQLLKVLQSITKGLFGIVPKTFKKYFKNKKRVSKQRKEIDYSSENVQMAIEKYNSLLYWEVKENFSSEKSSLVFILARKLRTFSSLLKTDPKRLASVVKSKVLRDKE